MNVNFQCVALCALAVIAGIVLTPLQLDAIPQYTLLSGNKCLNCHVNAQGGGQRNELGWYSKNDVGLFDPAGFGEVESNTLFDGLVLYGVDLRMQSSRSHKDPDAERRTFPMQAAFYVAADPVEWLGVEAQYNAGPTKYDGQQSWSASLLVKPSFELPSLRLGFMQPSIGMRYDDHTMFTRAIAGADYLPLIAPNYAEFGAEITYDTQKWLTVSAGLFRAENLAEATVAGPDGIPISLIGDEDELSISGRIVFWPRFADHLVNTWIGASYLQNGDFSLTNLFLGVGLTDALSLMVEYAVSDKENLRETNNISAELSWQWIDPVLLYVRGERGITDIRFPLADGTEVNVENSANHAVIGAQVFVLPSVEIRPEYRLLDIDQEPRTSEQFRSTRWHVQLHLFF